ncbi:MAG: hypothetical protein E4H14_07315 [Candidatus Thorarchaeota archaeon]|nr:MAG: hypothetical protein E4H14_07315 [Candidatus Thorarchaeota archaeon]
MDPVSLVIITAGILVITIFNYYLNLSPGSDPEDFAIGQPQLNINCDCYLNTLILGGIMIIAFSAASTLFSSRLELYVFGGIAFAVVTIAGIIGRRKRHAEWREDEQVIRRAIQKTQFERVRDGTVDILFDDEDDDKYDYEDY